MGISAKQISSILNGYSIEVTPASAANVVNFRDHLSQGTTVNVTFLPGSKLKDTIDVSIRLNNEGFNPVPHIAARNFESEVELEMFLDHLTSKAGVSEVLVIAGGISKPLGPYADSLKILTSGLLEKYAIRKVGVAGHPEGSPDIGAGDIIKAIKDKNEWAKNTEIEVYIATQFCFEVDPIISWELKLRQDGNKLPIHVGLPGLATLKTLLKFAKMSGIGPSMRVLTRQSKNLAKLILVQEPDKIISELAYAKEQDPKSLISKVHFYPFGGLAKTATWVNRVLAGHIIFDSKNSFKVRDKDC